MTITMRLAIVMLSGLVLAPSGAFAQSGAPDVNLGGSAAARQGDDFGRGAILGGSTNVLINGRPAATAGDKTNCGGTILSGAPNVFINGKPAATAGSAVSPCPP